MTGLVSVGSPKVSRVASIVTICAMTHSILTQIHMVGVLF